MEWKWKFLGAAVIASVLSVLIPPLRLATDVFLNDLEKELRKDFVLNSLGGNNPWTSKRHGIAEPGIGPPEGCYVDQVHMVGALYIARRHTS